MATQPVVDPVKMPSVKADNKIIANINAVCSCFARKAGSVQNTVDPDHRRR